MTAVAFNCNVILAADTHDYVHHDLEVTIVPGKKYIWVKDTLRLPENLVKSRKKIHFLMHGNLTVTSVPKGIQLNKEKGELKSEFFGINTARFEIKKKIPLNHYSLIVPKSKTGAGFTFTLNYEGIVHHPVEQAGAEYARGFSETPGIVSEDGAYLAGASFWVPWFNDDLVTFNLQTSIPEPYDTVSQGKRTGHETIGSTQITTWDSPEPMDEVYLVAAKFKEYSLKVGKVDVLAFLRSSDEGLANKYLETTGQYLEMYESLIGPYPYSKFALIENFWETGYGMPSFTLLGPKVIRFPFILHSSYPHELLHNWWGNSVFVDYDAGNWCEGLTVFMADHLIKQQRSQAVDYRKTTLQSYTHYAADKAEEFPLTKFKARYDSLSSSIGYGKSMMLFHMLRLEVGDKLFNRSIRHFYKENKFKRATFDDIRKSFETITGRDFKAFFRQWVERAGAPEIRLTYPSLRELDGRFELTFSLEQIQTGEPYNLKVPVAVSLEDQPAAVLKHLELNRQRRQYKFLFHHRPSAVDVDPRFDIFRKLHINEIPATLSNAFGAETALILLPSKAPQELLDGYRLLAETWAKDSKGKIKIETDNQVTALPTDKTVWLLGWENLHVDAVKAGITGLPAEFDAEGVTINRKKLAVDSKSIIAAVKNIKNPAQVVVLLTTDRTAALPGLARKLPHYGKYSYLAFEEDEPTNMYKGQWPAVNSPLSAVLVPAKPGASAIAVKRGKLAFQQPLARLKPVFSPKRMLGHVKLLASAELAGRGLGTKELAKTEDYIADSFKKAGLHPGGENGTFFRTWQTEAGKEKKTVTLRNVIGMLPGKNPALKDQPVILCAHHDHLGRGWPDVHKGDEGKIHPGADDNASGVAVMLELAHILGKSFKPQRTVLFIAFSGEESGLLGSARFVEQLKKGNIPPFKTITAVVNMDTVGRLTGTDKLMVIGGSSASEWKFIFMGIGYTVGIESQLVPQELDASDQVSFIRAGIPGIQLFTGPHRDYHRPSDTYDKISSPGLVKVATVAREAIVYLADREKPLTVQGAAAKAGQPAAAPAKTAAPKSGRRVRTGIMPDFAFAGKGLKVALVSPGSPALAAGLKKGDIVIKLGGKAVASLKEYSDVLKTFKPGDKTTLVYVREGKEYTVSLTLSAR
jgi:hypothetical protein